MNKRVLYTAKVDSHIRHFHLPFLEEFKKRGYIVDVASEGSDSLEYCDNKYNIKFGANPLSKDVKNSYKDLKKLIVENNYSLIVTNTAVASVVTRLAVHRSFRRDERPRVIYFAHGFHFLKGGSKKSWLLYFPVEYIFSKMTDDLIVINKEDYQIANRFNFSKKIHYVHGVGVDLEFYKKTTCKDKSEKYIITYVAELNDNKNQILLINAIRKLYSIDQQIQLNLVGEGINKEKLQNIINNNNLHDVVKLLGYRTDVKDILNCSSLVVATSKREGLPVNVIEAMAMSLPVIATNCRGHNDLVIDGVNGYVVSYDETELADRITEIKNSKKLQNDFSKNSRKIVQKYGLTNVKKELNKIFFNESDVK